MTAGEILLRVGAIASWIALGVLWIWTGVER